jgi:hypothetical protein
MPLDDTGFRDRFDPLDKIDRVIDLLAAEERWCKGALATPDGRRCILGAIQAVGGIRVLVRPVSIAIRQVTGRRYGWVGSYIIPRFNDHHATTHALVVTVLHRARENIIGDITQADAAFVRGKRLHRLRRLLSIS